MNLMAPKASREMECFGFPAIVTADKPSLGISEIKFKNSELIVYSKLGASEDRFELVLPVTSPIRLVEQSPASLIFSRLSQIGVGSEQYDVLRLVQDLINLERKLKDEVARPTNAHDFSLENECFSACAVGKQSPGVEVLVRNYIYTDKVSRDDLAKALRVLAKYINEPLVAKDVQLEFSDEAKRNFVASGASRLASMLGAKPDPGPGSRYISPRELAQMCLDTGGSFIFPTELSRMLTAIGTIVPQAFYLEALRELSFRSRKLNSDSQELRACSEGRVSNLEKAKLLAA